MMCRVFVEVMLIDRFHRSGCRGSKSSIQGEFEFWCDHRDQDGRTRQGRRSDLSVCQRICPNYLQVSHQVPYSVAATQTPIIFLGVGEHLTDLDKFSPQPFISKMLGMGDMQGLMETIQDMAMSNPDKRKEMAKKLEEGKLSIRDWREQISNVMSM